MTCEPCALASTLVGHHPSMALSVIGAWSISLRPPITVTSFLFNLPEGFSRHSVPHGKTRPAETDFTALLEMRRATEVHNEHARPSDRANVSDVRLPVRQQNLDFRDGCGVGSPPASRMFSIGCGSGPNGSNDPAADRGSTDTGSDDLENSEEPRGDLSWIPDPVRQLVDAKMTLGPPKSS
jgi:hypothetical protein